MMNRVALFFFLLLCVNLVLISCSAQKSHTNDLTELIPMDTLIVSNLPSRVITYYSFENQTQVNTYFTESENSIYFNYCIDSVTPTSKFKMKTLLNNFYIENENSCIVLYHNQKFAFRLNKKSEVVDSLIINLGKEQNRKIHLMTLAYGCPIFISNHEKIFYTTSFLDGTNDYEIKKESRHIYFSRNMVSKLQILKNEINFMSEGIGNFPRSFLSEKKFSNYFFSPTINRKGEIVASFNALDSLFVLSNNNAQQQVLVKSKYKTKEESDFDISILNDYTALNRASCERVSYIKCIYDSYRELYYVVATLPMQYENEDGTFNSPYNKPWSLIVINANFQQIAEIEMPSNLSKHELMIVPNGIAILDIALSNQIENKSAFVVYQIKNL